MARGSSTFINLFGEAYEPERPDTKVKGRSASKIEARNTLLLHRYYYYGKFTPNRYEIILQSLEAEFFLEQRTIQDIISASLLELRAIKDESPTVKDLRRLYPWMLW